MRWADLLEDANVFCIRLEPIAGKERTTELHTQYWRLLSHMVVHVFISPFRPG